MISPENIEQLRMLIREELERALGKYQIERRPPEDITVKRRAAALARWGRDANAVQVHRGRKPRKQANLHANAMQVHKTNGHDVIGEGELIATIPSLHGEVEVRRSFIMTLIEAYPSVMVAQEIDRAKLWLEANPTKRKKNVRRFLTSWVARKQERAI